MIETPLTADSLRSAAGELAHAERSNALTRETLDAAARVVAEALCDQAEHRAPTVTQSVVDARAQALGVALADVAVPTGRPLEIVRAGARTTQERSLVAALFARHLAAVLERRDGVSALRALLPSLDWIEFVGQYPPYTAARHTLDDETRDRLDEIVRAASVHAPTELAAAAVRALRGHAMTSTPMLAPAPTSAHRRALEAVTLHGEVEGFERLLWWRVLTVAFSAITGAVRTVLRLVFSMRSPAVVSLDGEALRVTGHTEILGRTLREFDVRMPVANLTEVRRETRYPLLPIAASVFALLVGSTLGAVLTIQGAGGRYWELVALGLGLIAGGVLFDFLLRAVFPGVLGKTRLVLRGTDKRGLTLTNLDVEALDRLLVALEVPREAPLLSGPGALSADTVRDPAPTRRTR
jgi:hypothetical protein